MFLYVRHTISTIKKYFMSSNSSFEIIFSVLESVFAFFVALLLFSYSPLVAIGLVAVYSLWRGNFVLLILFSFLYDLMYTDFYFFVPKLTVIVLVVTSILGFTWARISSTIRRGKFDYEF